MKVEVHRISADGDLVEATSPLPETDAEHVGVWFNRPVHLKLKLSVVSRVFVAMGSYEAEVTMECHRCLKRFTHRAASTDYIWEQAVRLSGDEIIDLTEGIREDIMLALPLKNLCSEDCKGLCPRCGKDLNEGACGCGPVQPGGAFDELDALMKPEGETP